MNELIKIQKRKIGENEVNAVSARDLYEFLGLDKSQWSRWAKMNIEENPFAENGQEFQGFDIVSSGNKTKDYMLTVRFAEKLSMTVKTEKGNQIRDFFVDCRDKLKEIQQNPFVSMSQAEIMIEALKMQIEQEKRLSTIEQKVDAFEKRADEVKQLTFDVPEVIVAEKSVRSKINELVRSYCYKTKCEYEDVWHKIYHEFKYRYHVDIPLKAKNAKVSKLTIAEKEGFLPQVYAVAYEIFVKEN